MTNQRPITTPCSICGENIEEKDFIEYAVTTLLNVENYETDTVHGQAHKICHIRDKYGD